MPGYRDIDYELKNSARKTTSICIERDGAIIALAPEPYDMEVIESILEVKRRWIYQNLAKWEDLNRTRVEKEFVNGEGFPYLGSSYRLQIVDKANNDLPLKNGIFFLKRSVLSKARDKFVDFYKEKAKARLPKYVDQYARMAGLQPSGIEYIVVRELAHLKYPNHTTDFWYTVEKVLPDYQQAKGWLRLYGAGLEL